MATRAREVYTHIRNFTCRFSMHTVDVHSTYLQSTGSLDAKVPYFFLVNFFVESNEILCTQSPLLEQIHEILLI